MTPTTFRNLFVVCALALASMASTAHASPGAKIWNRDASDHRFTIDIHGGFSYYGRGGVAGVRFNIPLAPQGFIRGKNDAFYLSLGVDTHIVRWYGRGCGDGWCDYGLGVGFPVAAHWEFYFFEKFSFFAEAGVNIFLHPGILRGDRRRFVEHPAAWVLAAAGVRWKFGRTVSFIARIGTPYVTAGISFEF
ncbi:MAG: hypothetical protein KF901_03135 [Myxococcales bacterium]|nr:hypothetical protein [Myxococcales bacterium]